jgi:hypothetical protein
VLLAGTAIRIELPPSLHRLAIERYEAVRQHIERADSPLRDRVSIFYPQGSMAIRATIKSRKRSEGFDIDIVAELLLTVGMAPGDVLDLLFEAINGPVGSRYHGMVERQTRCVTVYYQDGMHLDITPSILADETDPRKSMIFHAKPEERTTSHRRLLMNSFAFVEWFNGRVPIDIPFAEAYAERARSIDRTVRLAEAEAKPVPDHSTLEGGKSSTVVALQLLKRNRNVKYANRSGRAPPSVMMATFAGQAATPGNSISGALAAVSDRMLAALEDAHAKATPIVVRNPRCSVENFTDRWPENLQAQHVYIDDLRVFRRQLDALMSDRFSLEAKRDLLVLMFGEGPGRAAVEEYAARMGRSIKDGTRIVTPSGRVVPAAVAPSATIAALGASRPRNHTFFGMRWRPK